MHVKICGITNMADAICACQAGADLLGFVFYPPSSRYLPPSDAHRIIQALRAQGHLRQGQTRTVGLCVGLDPAALTHTARQAGVDLLQIYGTYAPEALGELPVRFFKSVRPASAATALDEARQFAPLGHPDGPQLLVDAYEEGAWGGTGKQTDWNIAHSLCALYARILLAGGLTPANVSAAIQQVKPWGVDVSSGVEAAPGRKDHEAVRAFIANAKQTDVEAGPAQGRAASSPKE